MAVTACSIVEGIDVVRHIGDRQLAVLVDLFLDPLFLEAAKEGGTAGPHIVSPDSAFVIVSDPDGRLQKYPMGSGAPVIVAGAEPGDEPLVWSRDGGSIWVLSRSTRPAKSFRIHLKPAQRTFWHDVP